MKVYALIRLVVDEPDTVADALLLRDMLNAATDRGFLPADVTPSETL